MSTKEKLDEGAKRRIRAARLLQAGRSPAEVAREVGAPRQTVRALIEREFGVRYSAVHVWRLLGQLGFSSQKPDRRALERDEVAIERWKKHTWPRLKKNPPRAKADRLR